MKARLLPMRLLMMVGSALLVSSAVSFASIQTVICHNSKSTPDFTFTNVPAPSSRDAATSAKFTIVDGEQDPNSGELERLHDGIVPTEADAPDENFFFDAGTKGGRIKIDLGRVREVKQVNTYSCHPN